jgi:KipI family sensor histidine kinase inhibitor
MSDAFPRIDAVGLDGLLVRFGDELSEPANRAALALRGFLEREGWDGVEEVSTSLVSTYVRFDPLHLSHPDLGARLRRALEAVDWYAEPLPQGRRLFRIPTVYGGDLAPQLGEAAALAGLSEGEAQEGLSKALTRVQTIGFAPGQPYLGELPPCWDIPRQSGLTPQVPIGALVVAIRQFVLFSVSTPTGWRHVGQTTAQLFRPSEEQPFLLRPGDEVIFPSITRDQYEVLKSQGQTGIKMEALA